MSETNVSVQRLVLRCTTPLCGGIATMEQKHAPKWAQKLRKCQTCYERRHWPISDAGEWVPISQNRGTEP